MKISNSKKQLARIISENGGWPRNADWAAQCKSDSTVSFYYGMAPYIEKGDDAWYGDYLGAKHDIDVEKVLPNWHQIILSSDEYFHLYPAQDADGWRGWKGGLCPVDIREVVDIQYREGTVIERADAGCFEWQHYALNTDIIAYRLHKQEHPHGIESMNTFAHEPTIEQLAADYRAKLAIAQQAQEEADSHRCGADAALQRLYLAGLELGLKIEPNEQKNEHNEPNEPLNITDWWDLRVGDIVECIGDWQDEPTNGCVCAVDRLESRDYPFSRAIRVVYDRDGDRAAWGDKFKFIRRP